MEKKSMVKLSHIVAFMLLASLFQPLTARYVSDEKEVLQFAATKENQEESPVCKGKHSWPELVGEPMWIAKAIIEKENPAANVVVLYPYMIRPSNFVCGRVFLVVNWKLNVQVIPTMEVCCLGEA